MAVLLLIPCYVVRDSNVLFINAVNAMFINAMFINVSVINVLNQIMLRYQCKVVYALCAMLAMQCCQC